MTGWDAIIGHDRVVHSLARAASQERPHHAYLLMGHDGVGKGTLARVFSQALLCDAEDAAARPCGTCPSCKRVQRESHVDHWIEIPTGKSNTITVDQVTEIQRRLSYRRADSRFRVVVIDGAGTLNESAQNKLLKTLEEPPEGTVLVLLALHPAQMLQTVRSRCQKIGLGPVDIPRLAHWLTEAHGADPAAAAALAASAGGLPGLAVTRLDPELAAAQRAALDQVVLALEGDEEAIEAIVDGVRWDREAALEVLTIVQNLIRDAVHRAFGSDAPPLHPEVRLERGRIATTPGERLATLVDRTERVRSRLHRNVNPAALLGRLLRDIAPRRAP